MGYAVVGLSVGSTVASVGDAEGTGEGLLVGDYVIFCFIGEGREGKLLKVKLGVRVCMVIGRFWFGYIVLTSVGDGVT